MEVLLDKTIQQYKSFMLSTNRILFNFLLLASRILTKKSNKEKGNFNLDRCF
jgi:hypothetical protein